MPETQAQPSSTNAMLFVQALRGAPASVLLALAFAGRFMSHKELQLWTRCGKNQITAALQTLTRLTWVVARSSRGPWALARVLGAIPADACIDGFPLKGLSSGGDSLNPLIEGTLLPSPLRRELHDALIQAGIREPTASELAELPHITVDYLQAHLQAARAHGLQLGAAIEAMRLNAPPPDLPSSRARSAEVERKFRRFLEGA